MCAHRKSTRPGIAPAHARRRAGQLVQETDAYLGVLGARVVLLCDTTVRAIMTASWLIQMGWEEVAVLEDDPSGARNLGPDCWEVPGLDAIEAELLSAADLAAAFQEETPPLVLDLSTSLAYRKSHIPGAAWAQRSLLDQASGALRSASGVVLTAEDERLARLTLPEVRALVPEVSVSLLAGGTAAWQAAGLAMESGLTKALTAVEDVWYKPYDNKDEIAQRMRDYLTWEIALVEQLARDGDQRFKAFD